MYSYYNIVSMYILSFDHIISKFISFSAIKQYAAVFLLTNFVSYWFNVYPLTAEEKRQQWLKYRHVGKLVYGLTFLTLEEDQKLWAKMKEDKAIKEEAAKH